MEEHGVAVGEVELLFLSSEPVCALLDARGESFADRASEQLVFFFGDLDFVQVRILDLVLDALLFRLSEGHD